MLGGDYGTEKAVVIAKVPKSCCIATTATFTGSRPFAEGNILYSPVIRLRSSEDASPNSSGM